MIDDIIDFLSNLMASIYGVLARLIDSLYEFFAGIGYSHPLHPPPIHLPIGLAIAAFVFGLIARLYRRPAFAQTARHCIIFGFISLLPTIMLGLTDWQFFYSAAWLHPIAMKLIFAGALLILMPAGILLSRKGKEGSRVVLLIYGLSFLGVVGAGYYGGELVFISRTPVPPPEFEAGAAIYKVNCSACHPQGGNIVNAYLSVLGAPQLIAPDTFLTYLRNPKRPNGTPGIMPPVPTSKITDQQVQQLFDYITKVLERPRRRMDDPKEFQAGCLRPRASVHIVRMESVKRPHSKKGVNDEKARFTNPHCQSYQPCCFSRGADGPNAERAEPAYDGPGNG